LKEQQKFNQQNEQYKDRLARKRHDDQLGKWCSADFFFCSADLENGFDFYL
jgi:hypothetical protein